MHRRSRCARSPPGRGRRGPRSRSLRRVRGRGIFGNAAVHIRERGVALIEQMARHCAADGVVVEADLRKALRAAAAWRVVPDFDHRCARRLCRFNLETAVGRARVGCDAVRWQGATTLRARARKEEQRGQRDAARPTRACSAVTLKVTTVVGAKLSRHQVCPVEASGPLPFLGSSRRNAPAAWWRPVTISAPGAQPISARNCASPRSIESPVEASSSAWPVSRSPSVRPGIALPKRRPGRSPRA